MDKAQKKTTHPQISPKHLLLAVAVAGNMASVATAASAAPTGWLQEAWVGVLAHDVHFAGGVEHGADVNGELRFRSPVTLPESLPVALRWLLQPHPAVGFEANTAGDTSQLYFTAIWGVPLVATAGALGDHGLFFNLGLGGALNNGHRHTLDPNRKNLGSHILFHASGELGLRVSVHTDLSLYFDHSSNAGLSRYNESINDAGVRLGWRF